MTQPISRRAAVRHAKAARRRLVATTGPLPTAPVWEGLAPRVRTAAESYRPYASRVGPGDWVVLRPLVLLLVAAYRPGTPMSARKQAGHVASFLAWWLTCSLRTAPGTPPNLAELVGCPVDPVEVYAATITNPASAATVRSTLRRALTGLVPASAPVLYTNTSKSARPYTPAQAHALMRLAANQPTEARRRDAAFLVALGLGAGLDARDLRHVHSDDIARDADGVWQVAVRSRQVHRTIPVRTAMVPLLAEAMVLHQTTGRGPQASVLSGSAKGNVSREVVSNLVVADASFDISQVPGRLRATWLLALLHAPVSLTTVLHLAGLTSAGSLSDVAAFAPPADTPTAVVVAAPLVEVDR